MSDGLSLEAILAEHDSDSDAGDNHMQKISDLVDNLSTDDDDDTLTRPAAPSDAQISRSRASALSTTSIPGARGRSSLAPDLELLKELQAENSDLGIDIGALQERFSHLSSFEQAGVAAQESRKRSIVSPSDEPTEPPVMMSLDQILEEFDGADEPSPNGDEVDKIVQQVSAEGGDDDDTDGALSYSAETLANRMSGRASDDLAVPVFAPARPISNITSLPHSNRVAHRQAHADSFAKSPAMPSIISQSQNSTPPASKLISSPAVQVVPSPKQASPAPSPRVRSTYSDSFITSEALELIVGDPNPAVWEAKPKPLSLNQPDSTPSKIEPDNVQNSSTPQLSAQVSAIISMDAQVQTSLYPPVSAPKSSLHECRSAVKSAPSEAHRILRLNNKSKISEMLSDQKTRDASGMPTALAVHSKLLAIGTSHGKVLLFDHFESLKQTLRLAVESMAGPTTSLDISPSAEFVVAGFQNGNVVLWDVMSGVVVKSVTEYHKCPVLHVRFQHPTKCQVLTTDSKGVCNIMKFNKTLGLWRVDVSCVLDGESGELVYDVAVLMGNDNCPHPTDEFGIVAFASANMVFVICCHPTIDIVYRIQRPASTRATALPYLAWRRAMARDSRASTDDKDRLLDPVLCIAWGKQVRLVQLTATPQPKPAETTPHTARGGAMAMAALMGMSSSSLPANFEFSQLCEYNAPDVEFTGVEWLGEHVILTFNTKGQIRAVDPFAMNELDSLDINNLQIVFQAHYAPHVDQSSGASTASRHEYSYYNSFRCAGSEMYLLGLQQLQTARVLTWSDRLVCLTEAGQWLDALAFAMDIREGSAKAVVGLPRNTKVFNNMLGRRVVDLVDDYLKHYAKSLADARDKQVVDDHFRTLASVTVDFCVTMERLDLLFAKVYPVFVKANCAATLLEAMEPHILKDRVNHLDSHLMKEVLQYYGGVNTDGSLPQKRNPQRDQRAARLESLLLHLDATSLASTEQLIEVCRFHRLYVATTHIYTAGLDDYAAPLNLMMGDLRASACSATTKQGVLTFDDESKNTGYLLLLFLSKCLSAKSFPFGTPIPQKRVPAIKASIFDFLFPLKSAPEQDQFSNLFVLLQLDTQETLQLIESAVGDPDFVPSTNANLPTDPPADLPVESTKSDCATAQRISLGTLVNVLLGPEISGPGLPWDSDSSLSTKSSWPMHEAFSKDQKRLAYLFLAKMMIHGKVEVSREIVQKILLWLATASGNSATDKNQQDTLIALLKSLDPQQYKYVKTDLVIALERSKFNHSLVWLHDNSGDFLQALDVYLKDESLRSKTFAYVERIISDSDNENSNDGAIDELRVLNAADRERVKDKVLSCMHDLIKIDRNATANLIADVFMNDHERVVTQLEDHPELQYEYLRGVIERAAAVQPSDSLEGSFRTRNAGVRVAEREHERFIELMARFEPHKVYPYLISHNSYRLDFALRVCQEHKIVDASSFLLERTGDVIGALKLIIQSIFECLKDLRREVETIPLGEGVVELHADCELGDNRKAMAATLAELNKAIAICERNVSHSIDESENQMLWFRLLDTFAVPLRQLKQHAAPKTASLLQRKYTGRERMHAALTRLLAAVINSMMGHVPFEAVLEKLGSEYGQDELGEFRSMLKGMLETYNFEQVILETAKKIWDNDLFGAIEHLHHLRVRSICPKSQKCGLCAVLLEDGAASRGGVRGDKVKVFACGHGFHVTCMGQSLVCPLCQASGQKQHRRGRSHATSEDLSASMQAVAEANAATNETSAKTNTAVYLKRLAKLHLNERNNNKIAALPTANSLGWAKLTDTMFEKGKQRQDENSDSAGSFSRAMPGSLPIQPAFVIRMSNPVH